LLALPVGVAQKPNKLGTMDIRPTGAVADPITPAMLDREKERKQHMGADELAWEVTLEKNLGNFYLARYYEDRDQDRENAWDYVKDDPRLPRLLIIGDSISRGYTMPVRHLLSGKVNVHRAPANCGSTDSGLQHLDTWLGDSKWDVILWNFGIHDRNTATNVYQQHLELLLSRLRRTNAKIVWVRTTPAPPSGISQEGITFQEVEQLNHAADAVMTRNAIPEVDLYSLLAPRLGQLQLENNVHFTDDGYAVMGNEIVNAVLAIDGLN